MNEGTIMEPLYIVFDGPPGHQSGRFVEVENSDGEGLSGGEWKQAGEFWRLGPVFSAKAIDALTKQRDALRAALERALPVLKDAPAAEALLDSSNIGPEIFQGVDTRAALDIVRQALAGQPEIVVE